MTAFSWKDAPDLMDALARTQNAPCNSNIDIMTYAGFCNSRAQLEQHLIRYEAIETEAEMQAIRRRGSKK